MNSDGEIQHTDLLVRVRNALLDAIDALSEQRQAVIVIGAQAVYLRTGSAGVALAETTKDADIAIDPRRLVEHPLLELAMSAAGFAPSPTNQPGSWENAVGVPVDLMVPEALAGAGGKKSRGARIPPHSKKATRRAKGLEAAVADNSVLRVTAPAEFGDRDVEVQVAGPAALLVAKLHKIGERTRYPTRLSDKDAHDVYRILRSIPTEELAITFRRLLDEDVCAEVTSEASGILHRLFSTPDSLGSVMAGRAEAGVGDPEQVAVSVAFLAQDLLEMLAGPS
jgi:hypothetical protein